MRRLAYILTISVVACGGGRRPDSPDSAPPPPPPADAPTAPPPDAPPPAASLAIDDGSGAITAWVSADTRVGAHAGATLFVINRGTLASGALALSITGANAGDFAIVAAGSACAGKALVAGDLCPVRVSFAPTAAGPRSAALHITGGTDDLDVTLHGVATARAATGLVLDASQIDFGAIELGQTGAAQAILSNPSGGTLTLDPRKASAGFTVTDNCPAALAPGAACTLDLQFKPSTSGLVTGTLTASAGAVTATAALRGVGMHRVTIALHGPGRVTSVPTGIDCGASCTGLFLGTVTLTASPDAGAHFTGWAECGAQPTCAVPGNFPSVTLDASFVGADSKAIAIALAGDGKGRIELRDSSSDNVITTCAASCTIYVAPGSEIALVALTPETFGGWSGACTGSARDCNLGTIINDRAVTATFAKDAREVTTLLASVPSSELAYAPDGDLVTAGGGIVAKLSPTGVVRWSRQVSAAATRSVDLAVGGDGAIFYLRQEGAADATTITLHKLSAAGDVLWTHAFGKAALCDDNPYGKYVAVAPSGDVGVLAVIGSGSLVVLHGDQSPAWTQDKLLSCRGVAVSAAGVWHVAVDNGNGDDTEIARFTAAGVAQTSIGDVRGYYLAIAVDGSGAVAAHSSGHSQVHVSRTLASGEPAFQSYQDTTSPGAVNDGVAYDSAGDVIAAREVDSNVWPSGVHLEQLTPTGDTTWTLDKQGFATALDQRDGFDGLAIATDGAKHVAVSGSYDGNGWIEIFAMP
jgi:Abnormal spindle-like microcephaly-assoc'd, ASPM-SPD-2-Hydin/Divergent InlB B-repeat domain